jgi:hypothetical protein
MSLWLSCPSLHYKSYNYTKVLTGFSFLRWQIDRDQELQQILSWVEKFPSACPRWFWGSRAFFTVYDPEYMKVILGRSGESQTSLCTEKLLPLWYTFLACQIPEENDTSAITLHALPTILPSHNQHITNYTHYWTFQIAVWNQITLSFWFLCYLIKLR